VKKHNKLEMLVDGEIQRVSQEAIWVEFTKAWKKAKDFTQYIKFITEFEMWNEVFPGISINIDVKPTTDFYVMLSQLFSKSRKMDLAKFLKEKLKIDDNTAKIVQFLLELRKYEVEDVLKFKSNMKKLHIDNETIREFYRVFDIDGKHHWSFLKFEKSVDPTNIIKLGFKGKGIGDEIARLEIEKFKDFLN